jgi:hypothetical protein
VKQALLLTMGLWLLGCDDPLKTVELIEQPRVLGARVEVTGDTGRAAPAPGESATLTLFVAAPELEPSFGFALAACSAAPRNGARGSCALAPFARILRENAPGAVAALDFEVPADLDPSGRVLVLGVVCPNGSPRADAASCDGEHAGTPVQLELELSRPGDVNRNPELPADSITFDDNAWAELPAVDVDCAGLGFPEVASGSQHRIDVRLDESDRDALPRPSKLDPSRESLQLSHFISAGDISRAFETIAWDSDELNRHVDWTAPKTPGLTRAWFMLRDFRGGGAFTARSVCVQ